VAALEQARWSRKRAAELLGVGRSTFYEWLDRYPQLRSVLALEEKALRERLAAVGGDLARLAVELGTSTALVQRRLARKR
jgi:two-component system nitrogen regulation response regulator GlnG